MRGCAGAAAFGFGMSRVKPSGVFRLACGPPARLALARPSDAAHPVARRTALHFRSGTLHGMNDRIARATALGQGVFYLATGVWPLLHMGSFEAVTGPKTDDWLVRTVGVLVAVVGAVLVQAGRRGRVTAEIALLGAGSALGLAAIDVVYSLSGVISSIYLLDAVVELGLAALWLIAASRGARARP